MIFFLLFSCFLLLMGGKEEEGKGRGTHVAMAWYAAHWHV